MRERPLFSRTSSVGPQAHTFGPGPARRRPAASTQHVESAEWAKSEEPLEHAHEAASAPLEPTGPSQRDFMSQLRDAAGYSEPEPKFESLDESGEKGVSEMDDGAKAFARPAASRSLRDAIRKARLDEAERLDRTADDRDGEIARLELLKAELDAVFAEIPSQDDRFNLALVPSRPARLWIDVFTYVAVDDATNAYLFIRNSENGRRTLFSTSNVAEMSDRITSYVAGEIVRRERIESALVERSGPMRAAAPEQELRLNTRMVILSFIVGLLTGAAGLFAAVWLSAT
ncbi:MAG: hypothetical protein KDJ72_13800 [Methyloceanibacter sp.]|uniref:hypothetical protein n=1 Tax=Methyloceanibacter sp. TaxID=1965321 RepID=UPI001DA4C6F8|nr:hypothetical protein [Methyloceanibacter sp.]MCB1444085.1 hypothetical protein [Methyloceanibacter sp.]